MSSVQHGAPLVALVPKRNSELCARQGRKKRLADKRVSCSCMSESLTAPFCF